MGYLETAVVVYLRALYYPEGFSFPLKLVSPGIALTEIFRELATLIMLIGTGIVAGRTKTEKFAYFIYSFAVWDIFYYVFLKIILNWPESLFTWDILFLIPTTWVGPVIAPVINSLAMILFALLIIIFTSRKGNITVKALEWILLITGSVIVIIAYTHEYSAYISGRFSLADIWTISNSKEVLDYASKFIPQKFDWYIYWIGSGMHIAAIGLFVRRMRKLS
ncbi:MAG: hypothetical protein HY958_00260 [Bacteroidia bacterium]|nr:hypothetical protein [Bacteroidia bacterium]